MRSLLKLRYRPILVALAVGLLLAALPSAMFAAGPSITITGSGVARCASSNRPVASVVQGEAFNVALTDFPSRQIGISFTFPDGRVLSPSEASRLDGVSDYPPPFPGSDSRYLDPINAAATFTARTTWPTGCYTITAAELGASSLKASAYLMVLPKPHGSQAGNLTLSVQSAGSYQPTGQQSVRVNIFGHNVPNTRSGFSIEIVQPDGSIITLPAWCISISQGNFTAAYDFTAMHQTGLYTFYATLTLASGATYTAKAQFTLTAAPTGDTGNASLTIIDPFTGQVQHNTPISIQGRGFTPGRQVDIILVLPNGARICLTCVAYVDRSGNVMLPPICLGRHFPKGTYQLIVTDGTRTATTSWQLV